MKGRKNHKLARSKINPRYVRSRPEASSATSPLVALAAQLLHESHALWLDILINDILTRHENLNLARGLSLQTEVRRFETDLINVALQCAVGNQARAARFLGI